MPPLNGDSDCCWRALSEELIGGIKKRRLQHPKATLREIGAAVDQRPPRFRACMLPATTFMLPVAGIFAASPVTAGWCATPEGAPTPWSPSLAAVVSCWSIAYALSLKAVEAKRRQDKITEWLPLPLQAPLPGFLLVFVVLSTASHGIFLRILLVAAL